MPNNRSNGSKGGGSNLFIWAAGMFIALMLINWLFAKPPEGTEIIFSDFLDAVEKNQVQEVVIVEKKITGKFKDTKTEGGKIQKREIFRTYGEYPELIKILSEKKIKFSQQPPPAPSWLFIIIRDFFPAIFALFMIVALVSFMRNMRGGTNQLIFSLGKSRGKLANPVVKTTFADVAGIDEAKNELKEVVDFLKNPGKFTKIGGRIPKGILLVGPPGTGKTLLAKAVAGEAGVPFFSVSGSEFVEMYVGIGAARVRDLFSEGKKKAPCIIFVDEIDAVGRQRGAGLGGGHDEKEQTLNQLLAEMDGFESNSSIIIVAATNRPDILDPALLRPGRFDRTVAVQLPDIEGRKAIFAVHLKNIRLAEDVDIAVLARGTPGFSGAIIANLVNEAALLAASKNDKEVSMCHLEIAKDKLIMGSERKSAIISEEEKKLIAYHEAGHTLVAKMLPGSDPIHKVTIIPRGMALGLTQQLPLNEKHIYSRKYLWTRLVILMGGRVAEDLIFRDLSTGASNDINQATGIAGDMVRKWGMSEELGPISLDSDREIFLGKTFSTPKEYSESTAATIDKEIKKLVSEGETKARQILHKNLKLLHKIAEELLAKESLSGDEINNLVKENDSA